MITRRAIAFVAVSGLLAGCSDPIAARDRFLVSGDRYRADKRLVEATIEYRNAAERDPQSADAQRKLAETYVELNKPEEALAAYGKLADLDPRNVPARLRAASLLAAGGEFACRGEGAAGDCARPAQSRRTHPAGAGAGRFAAAG